MPRRKAAATAADPPVPDPGSLEPSAAQLLCRFCLRKPTASSAAALKKLRVDTGHWADSQMGRLYERLTGEMLIDIKADDGDDDDHHRTSTPSLISCRWCSDCQQRLRSAIKTADQFRAANAFWADYLRQRSSDPKSPPPPPNAEIVKVEPVTVDDLKAEEEQGDEEDAGRRSLAVECVKTEQPFAADVFTEPALDISLQTADGDSEADDSENDNDDGGHRSDSSSSSSSGSTSAVQSGRSAKKQQSVKQPSKKPETKRRAYTRRKPLAAKAPPPPASGEPKPKPAHYLAPQMCELCGKVYKGKMERHMLAAHSTLECDLCGRTFTHKVILRRHFRNDHGYERHNCDICGATNFTRSMFRRHMEQHRPIAERPFACDQCGSNYRTERVLKQHVARAHDSTEATCPECGKRFVNVVRLRDHMIRHRPRTIRCPLAACPRMFFQTKEMKEHYRTVHVKDRKYACDVCGKAFLVNAQLKKHHSLGRCPGAGPDGRVVVRVTKTRPGRRPVDAAEVQNAAGPVEEQQNQHQRQMSAAAAMAAKTVAETHQMFMMQHQHQQQQNQQQLLNHAHHQSHAGHGVFAGSAAQTPASWATMSPASHVGSPPPMVAADRLAPDGGHRGAELMGAVAPMNSFMR